MSNQYKIALVELIAAIDARWCGESDRKRANAISPRMEEAIAAAGKLLEAETDNAKAAIELLKADARRSLYEAADKSGKSGCGEYYVDYSNGASPILNINQVNELVRDGWLREDPQCQGLYNRGPRLESGIKSTVPQAK